MLLVLAAGTIPFIITYLPVLQANGMHSAATALAVVPRPLDLINVGDGNLLYGSLNGLLALGLVLLYRVTRSINFARRLSN